MESCCICRKRPRSKACGKLVYVSAECPVCLEVCDRLVALPCGHAICEPDFQRCGWSLVPEAEAAKRQTRARRASTSDSSSSPPSGASTLHSAGLEVGGAVRISGVASRPALNGQVGTLEALLPTGRWQVKMDASSEVVSLKPESLRVVERGARMTAAGSAGWVPPHAASAGLGTTGGWKPGELALVHGVSQRPDLNGQIVTLIAFLPSGRWQVRVLSTDAEVSIRPDNLRRDSSISGPCTQPSAAPPPGAFADADGIARGIREIPLADRLEQWLMVQPRTGLVAYLRSIQRPANGKKAELVRRILLYGIPQR